MPTSSSTSHLHNLLQSSLPFLRQDLTTLNPILPTLLTILHSAGAGECWHRLGTFSDHLFNVYRILNLWKAPEPICLFGLFHSVYSNSYHDLAIFNPETVRRHVGPVAEELIHLFCIVPRHTLIHDNLVFRYTDTELRDHLQASECSSLEHSERSNSSLEHSERSNSSLEHSERSNSSLEHSETDWRKKVQELVPVTGVEVKHIRTGEPVVIPRRVLAVFLLMTIADFADQYYGYQDELYDNIDGRLEFTGNTNFDVLWPGNGKPGLWMNLVSKMGAIYTLLVREEEIFMQENQERQSGRVENGFDGLELVIPPVFDWCRNVLDPGEQIVARDLYWEAVYGENGLDKEKGEELLIKCIEKNPYVGEPHVLLSQFYVSRGRFEEGEKECEKGLGLLLEWGCAWDKRVSWEGWVAWSRVVLSKAKERSWPHTSWGIISLGLVK